LSLCSPEFITNCSHGKEMEVKLVLGGSAVHVPVVPAVGKGYESSK
jgi:hypothetical protein